MLIMYLLPLRKKQGTLNSINNDTYIYNIQRTVQAQLKDSNGNYITNIVIWIFQLSLYSALDKVNICIIVNAI